MHILSENVELRYVSHDPAANGETDFKGETSTLTTQQRIDYLNRYAEVLPRHVKNFDLDTPIVPLGKAIERMKSLKPQPRPQVRRRIHLDAWRWTGDQSGLNRVRLDKASGQAAIPVQDWRCFVEWTLEHTPAHGEFSLGQAAKAGFDDGRLYYITNDQPAVVEVDSVRTLRMEVDFVTRRWNLLVNGEIKADFVPLSNPDCASADRITWPTEIRAVWGIGYHLKSDDAYEPISMEMLLDEDFTEPVCMDGWKKPGYDDSRWQQGTLPIVHGGLRHAGEELCLRRTVQIDEIPPVAELYVESLIPGGEIYVNGRLAAHVTNACQHRVDIAKDLHEGENQLAVLVYTNEIPQQDKMTHTHADVHTGWSAGRMHLDLLGEIWIDDVFTWTGSIADGRAEQKIRATVKGMRGMASAHAVPHMLRATLSLWLPEEGEPCARTVWPTTVLPNIAETTEVSLTVDKPALWTSANPQLYQLHVELIAPDGTVVDDYTVTTGLRTVGQPGGVFCINGQPELLRAPLLFGARPPMENIALWEMCPPAEYYVQEMLMVQGMNGNGLRTSVHDRRIGGLNDPRICEIADQLGIMLIWQTNTWLRITSATNINYDELALDIRQVRNHPSIVIWQPTNHPSWKDWATTCRVHQQMHDEIMALDPSRLISSSADSRRMRARFDDGLHDHFGNPCNDPNPSWTLPGMVRGNMDYMLGYGSEWHTLREWPNVTREHLPCWNESTAYIPSFISSPERAYFNFEHDEIIGQPNWKVHRGKPSYQVASYEHFYDEGSIGRKLGFDEWLTSQAWQALGAYETVVKCRWLDYDGLSWCNLRGGQNTCTYMKSLVDYYGQPKLAYYAHQLAFQDVLALSGNVDMVYGPEDTVPVILLNLGPEKKVTLQVQVVDDSGAVVLEQTFADLCLPAGRTVTKVADMTLPELPEGLFSFVYRICQ